MVEVTKIGNKTLVMDGKILSLFRKGSLLRQMYYGGYEDFDGANGGVWKKYINIPITTIPSEYAQYLIKIDDTNVSVYNADGVLKAQASIASEFWDLVRSDGLDIRPFDHLFNQLFFFVKEFDYTNKFVEIWVKLPKNSQELNIAYGNQNATKSSYENPEQVFEFYDDFSSDPVEKGWSLDTGWSWDSVNKYLHFDRSEDVGYNAISPYDISDGVVVYKLRYTGTGIGANDYLLLNLRKTSNDAYIVGLGKEANFGEGFHIGARNDGSWRGWLKQVAYDYNLNQWYEVKVSIYDVPANIKGYINDTLIVSWKDTIAQDSVGDLGIHGRDCKGDIDYIFVAKFADPASFATPRIIEF